MTIRTKCILVTAFAEGQPGFLDFSYRIKALASEYDLTVISTSVLEQAELQFSGVRYVVMAVSNDRSGWLKYLWRCSRLIRTERPGLVVLLHSLAAPVALMTGAIPVVTYWNEHPTHTAPKPSGFSPLRALLRSAVRGLMYWGARCSTVVMPIGEAHEVDLLAHGCQAENVRLIYMGVDDCFVGARAVAESGGPLRLLYIGSVSSERGRDVMLDAMAQVKRLAANVHLAIVGASDAQLDYCLEKIRELDIADQVSIQGRVPGSMIPSYCARADIGLCLWEDLPWFRFNPPTKLFEYLVAGLPVLASNIRTHTAYIRDGENGCIFNYNPSSLAASILHLSAAPELVNELQAHARAASKNYVWSNIEPMFLKHVEEVIR